MPQPTSSHANGKAEKMWQHYLPFSAQPATRNTLRLREALCLGQGGSDMRAPTDPKGSLMFERVSHPFPVTKSPSKTRGERFMGSGLSSGKGVNFTTPSVLRAPSSSPSDSQKVSVLAAQGR